MKISTIMFSKQKKEYGPVMAE